MNDGRFTQFRGRFPKPQGKVPKEYTCHTRYAPKEHSLDSLLDNTVDFGMEEEVQPAE